MNKQMLDVAIVGGGIVGAATAYKLQRACPNKRMGLFEKEAALAAHQTGHNSGVIHSGLYYKPGSAKAKNCVNGRRQLVAFAQEHKIRHDVCGKVVVATDKAELPYLDKIYGNGLANEIEGIQKIDAAEIKDIEPHCVGIAGIQVPCTGIIDFPAVTRACADKMQGINADSQVFLQTEVTAVDKGEVNTVHTNKGDFQARHVIYCGGLQADRLATKDQVELDLQIVGFRGDYYELTDAAKHKVRHLIYPVPNPAFPFLGVHFTRMVNGDIECGPNAVFTFKREGYSKTAFSLRDTSQALSYRGTWRLFQQHWRFGLDEYRRAFSKQLFLKTLQRLLPSLTMEDLRPGRAGVRAMALQADGNMVDDFKIAYQDRAIHVLNAPSPAATACLSIGDEVTKMAKAHFALD